MGVDIYLREVVGEDDKGELMSVQHLRHLRSVFRDKVFIWNLARSRDYKKPFRTRGLSYKDWYYCENSEDGYAYYRHRNDGSKVIMIHDDEFEYGFYPRKCIKVKEIGYLSGSGKLYSAWFGLYDFLSDDYPLVWNNFLNLVGKEAVRTFIERFVLPRYRELFRERILSKMSERGIMSIGW